MKKKWLISLGIILAISTIFLISHCTSVFHFPLKNGQSIAPFLTTEWQQMGGFNKFTPQNERIGCWGTAFAQILYHHKVKPSGEVEYVCSNGTNINESFDSYSFDFDVFESKLDSASDDLSIDQMAMYNFFTAACVRKDFGTGNGSILHKTKVGKELESHYPVSTNWYVSMKGQYPYTNGKLQTVIVRELNQKRPIYFYFWDGGQYGHAAVIDGYKKKKGKFLVHINQGQGGEGNDWYDFNDSILHEGDMHTRFIYTIKPVTI